MTGRRMRRRGTRLATCLLVIAAIACSGTQRKAEREAAAPADSSSAAAPGVPVVNAPMSRPHIDAVVPDSVSVQRHSVKELLIRGTGFAAGTPGRNTVMIGPIRLTQVPANAAGTEIRVIIPDRIVGASEAPPRPVLPGRYAVSVETAAGISNAVNVQVLP
jgi:hypothetical protein